MCIISLVVLRVVLPQISILLLSFLYLFIELMITMNAWILFKPITDETVNHLGSGPQKRLSPMVQTNYIKMQKKKSKKSETMLSAVVLTQDQNTQKSGN